MDVVKVYGGAKVKMRVLSPEFNRVVELMAGDLRYTLTRDQYGSFEEMKADSQMRGGVFSVNTLHSQTSIFGEPRINWMFRAWHDAAHLAVDAGFDPEGEAKAARYQILQMRFRKVSSPLFEALVDIEVNGQGNWFAQTGSFPTDQYDFTVLKLQERRISW